MSKPRIQRPVAVHRESVVFERTATPLFEEDISALHPLISGWKARGIDNIRGYLSSHLSILRRAIHTIQITDVNAATLKLYEAQEKSQLLGPLEALIDPESLGASIELIVAIAEGRTELEVESTALTLSGKRLEVLVKTYIPDHGDPYPCILVNVTDVTERKRLERRLRQERSLLLSLINNSPDLFFYKDVESRFLLVNRSFADLAGLREPNDAVGRTDFDLFPREIAEKYRADDRHVMESNRQSEDIEESAVLPDGSTRWLLTRKVPITDAAERVIGVLGTSHDVTERKLAAEELARERSILTALMDNIPDHIYFKDRQSRFILNNKAHARDLRAASPEEMVGKSDFDYFSRDFAQKAYDDEQRIIRTGEPLISVDEGYLWADRPHMWVSTTKMPLRNEKGEIVGTFGISRDVSERRQMMEQLEESRTYAESLIQTANIMVLGMDNQFRINAFNEMAEKITGYRREELENKFLLEVLTPRERYPEVWARIRDAAQDGLPRIFEAPLLTKSGEERHIVWHNGEIRKNGVPVGSIGFGVDITERRHMEEKNIQLATLVESSNEAIIGVDSNDMVSSWNKGAETMYGYRAAEMIGRPVYTIVPPDMEKQARANRDRVKRGESVIHFETERIRKDGKRIFVALTLSPIRDAQGSIVGIASISSDITSQKALQAQLIRAQRLESLATLAGGIAHQFNNINTGIKGYLEILMLSGNLSPEARTYVRGALGSLDRAVSITDRLQGLTSSSPSSVEEVDLAELVRSLLPLYETRFDIEGVVVTTDFKQPVFARANRSMLGFVTGSLLTNSLHALLERPKRRIDIRTKRGEGFAALEVSDTGCGIPRENLPRIFTPFFTTKGEWAEPGSPQMRVKGVGLSLAVSQSTIAELGGWIEVESVPGVGATFRVWLPAAGAAMTDGAVPAAGPS